MLVAVAGTAPATGCGEVRYRDDIRPDGDIQKLVVNGDVGIIEIIPSDATRIEYAVRAPEGTALVQHTEVDGILEMTSRCRTPILCSVDTEIHVGPNVILEVELDRGEVWATGVGAINVSVGDGTVDIESLGRTTVQIGTGSARVVSRGHENIRVAVGQGDIEAIVTPDEWNVSIVAAGESITGITHDGESAGSLELVAPAGVVKVRSAEQQTDSGKP